jgi:hypothetical protein
MVLFPCTLYSWLHSDFDHTLYTDLHVDMLCVKHSGYFLHYHRPEIKLEIYLT